MDAEKSVICKVIHSGEIRSIIDRRITSDMFFDERNRKVFMYVMDYYKKYGTVPIIEVMDREFSDYPILHIKEPVDYCIDKVVEKYVRNKGSDILLKNTSNFVNNPMEGLDKLRDHFNNLYINANPTEDSNVLESVDERMKFYTKMKDLGGIDGYSTPWEPLDRATMGWHPEELIVIVSRTGIGKTWALTIISEHCWNNDLSVLFVSNEMSAQQIQRRFDAVHFKLPYSEFREGLMADGHEERYFKGLQDLKNSGKKPIWVVGNIGGVSAIASKIDQYKPDIVCVDGMYLLQDDRRGRDKWERTSNISRDLKQLSTQKKLPVIATTQFNRAMEGFKFDDVTLASLGFSDSIGQDGSVVIGLFRSKDMELNRVMYVRMLKVREGEPVDFSVNWNLHTMDFSLLQEDDSRIFIEDGEVDDADLDY